MCATILFFGSDALSQTTAPNVYDCRAQQYFQQNDKGFLADLLLDPKTTYVQEVKGASFLVERWTGKALTRVTALSFLPNYLPEVAEQGNDKQSFKVRYTTPPGPHLHLAYLEVKTYVPTIEKPFVLIDGGSVFAGMCK